ncbi:ABC transporter B family member 15-like [Cornus florida]|uniref:ABC transporter B family member 15-like n=1 Tax=Cornus florida TaxID=4283 RepID=UPI0028A07BBE|nr:ABC transporter B family member 15-like [Cornus florida]
MGELDQEIEKSDELSSKPEGNGNPTTSGGSLRMVLKHSDWIDMLLMVLGTIGCVSDGMCMPAVLLVLSHLMNGYAAASSLTLEDIDKYALVLLYVAVCVGCSAFLEGFCWARTAERQTSRVRTKYLQAVLRQDVGFFDSVHGASLTSRVVSSISTDMLTIQGVLSEKIPNFIMNVAMFITALVAALYLCWRLAIIAIPALSMLIIPGVVYWKLLSGVGEKVQEAYAVAGGVVEQALSLIRTVYSYVGEERTVKSYSNALEPTLKLGIKQGLMKGMAMGSVGVTYAVWALQGWYGSVLVTKKGVKGGDAFTAGVCVVYAGVGLGSSLVNVKYFMEANAASAFIFDMIERVPSIDSADRQGETISNVKGELDFKDIDFSYPSRPGSLVLKNFNLRVMASQTVGLVGRSGSGKSTVINLLQRFYDPLKGEILLDGISINSLQLYWLRSQIGLVSQEPILFATSIKENILFGKEDASQDEIVQAAKSANAHNFITQLPNGYDTLVGQLGFQMSGGQKQRISIARALLRDPRILLLDEATSSLDSQSEKTVQDALNQASIGRTTVIIAHRLSALCNADLIAVIQHGQMVESGSHNQLIQNKNGQYSAMVQLQKISMNDESTSKSEVTESNNSPSPSKDTQKADASNNLIPQLSSPNKKTNQQPEEQDHPPSLWQLIGMTASEWKSTLIGCIGALCYGLIQPCESFCLGALLSVYYINDHDEIRSQTRIYCFVFLSLSIFAFITNVIQHYHFGIMGENLTKRVREEVFAKILTFEIEWFDQESSNSGALCSRLATDATMVRTLVADRLAFLTQAISSATLAVILSLLLAWKFALAAIAMQPLIIGTFYIKAVMMRTMSVKILKAQNRSSELASEAIGNHRIITAFYSQEKVMALFEATQIGPRKESHNQSLYAGLGLFTSQFLTAAIPGLLFWFGGRLLYHGNISYKHLFQTFFILVLTGRVIAETGSMTADFSKGTSALNSISTILRRKSKMDSNEANGINPEKINGDIEFKEVDFFYPTRPKQVILTSLSLKIDAGKVVALVGQSGCGKSTIIRMIERFYDPSKGSVEIDGIDIKSYNLRSLRSHIAWVGQEPTLFSGTIHENIAYGKENATETEIIEAATLANAHEFISSMKQGYETYCGERGVLLSGGQKQRIVLARAILKNPAIFLLDEATSALDMNSENLVQDALEKTMVGRTCLVVAHRLSTVQKSYKILVIDNGRMVEEGSHNDLIAKGERGAYFSLVRLQQQASLK